MRNLWSALLFLLLIGCVSDHQELTKAARPEPKAPPPVTAGEVTVENAHAISQALWDEMDREEHSEAPVSSEAVTPLGKK